MHYDYNTNYSHSARLTSTLDLPFVDCSEVVVDEAKRISTKIAADATEDQRRARLFRPVTPSGNSGGSFVNLWDELLGALPINHTVEYQGQPTWFYGRQNSCTSSGMGRYFPILFRKNKAAGENGPPRSHVTDIEEYLSFAAAPGPSDRPFGLDMPMGLGAMEEEDEEEEGGAGNDDVPAGGEASGPGGVGADDELDPLPPPRTDQYALAYVSAFRSISSEEDLVAAGIAPGVDGPVGNEYSKVWAWRWSNGAGRNNDDSALIVECLGSNEGYRSSFADMAKEMSPAETRMVAMAMGGKGFETRPPNLKAIGRWINAVPARRPFILLEKKDLEVRTHAFIFILSVVFVCCKIHNLTVAFFLFACICHGSSDYSRRNFLVGGFPAPTTILSLLYLARLRLPRPTFQQPQTMRRLL